MGFGQGHLPVGTRSESAYNNPAAKEAAKIAKEAQVKNLVLIHRPEFDTDLINNIKNIFPNTIFPNDFDIIEQ